MSWFNVAVPVFDTVTASSPDEAVRGLEAELSAAGFEPYTDADHPAGAVVTVKAGVFDVTAYVVEVVSALDAGSAVHALTQKLIAAEFEIDGPGDAFESECDPDGNSV